MPRPFFVGKISKKSKFFLRKPLTLSTKVDIIEPSREQVAGGIRRRARRERQ
nr:MAG TPA: hypothetical protein [Caudoviricetes sp.]